MKLAMILINKHSKLSIIAYHMALMSINDRPLIKPIMLIGFINAKFLLLGVNLVHFSNDHNIVRSPNCNRQNKLAMEFLDQFLQISKSEFRFRWKKI